MLNKQEKERYWNILDVIYKNSIQIYTANIISKKKRIQRLTDMNINIIGSLKGVINKERSWKEFLEVYERIKLNSN